MNFQIIRYILGSVLKIMAALLLLPVITAIIYKESEGIIYLAVALCTLLVGFILTFKKPENFKMYLKDGCVATALSWLVMSMVGALPFCLTGEIPFYVDALFETVSGFTTTGSSILTEVESLSHTALIWRSFTHWIGGMGVLVFLLAVIPMTGGSNMNLMKAESPGPSVGKLVPKVRQTARILYIIYILLTFTEFLFLVIGRLPIFDAMCMTFGTAGTGGFGVKNDSAMSYTAYQQWVLTIFMLLFGVNFNFYYFLLLKKTKLALKMGEVKCYFGIVLATITIITLDNLRLFSNALTSLRHSSFQVATIITTTGFASQDFDKWSSLSKTLLVLLMFCGACAGSTGGGVKVSRVMIGFKTWKNEMQSFIHPKSIRHIKYDGKPLDKTVEHSVARYFITYLTIFIISLVFISFEGKDLITNFTAVAATLNNIGPGLNIVGPTGNYSSFNVFSKFVFIFDMLAGRLELYPMLLIFHPSVWRK